MIYLLLWLYGVIATSWAIKIHLSQSAGYHAVVVLLWPISLPALLLAAIINFAIS